MSCTDTEREGFGDEQRRSDCLERAPPVLDSAVPGDRLSVLGRAVCVDEESIYFVLENECIQTGKKNVYKLKEN